MQLSMTLPTMLPHGRDEDLAWCRAVDEGPWASLAVPERITYMSHSWVVQLGAAAALTERVRLWTTIVILPAHDAVETAKHLASVDRLSDGRLTLGVGVGGREHDYRTIRPPTESGRIVRAQDHHRWLAGRPDQQRRWTDGEHVGRRCIVDRSWRCLGPPCGRIDPRDGRIVSQRHYPVGPRQHLRPVHLRRRRIGIDDHDFAAHIHPQCRAAEPRELHRFLASGRPNS